MTTYVSYANKIENILSNALDRSLMSKIKRSGPRSMPFKVEENDNHNIS